MSSAWVVRGRVWVTIGLVACATPERNAADSGTLSIEESVEAECEQAEACASEHGYDFDMQACVDEGIALFEAADSSGCADAYAEAFRCQSDEAVCLDGVWTAEVECDSLLSAYAACGQD